MNVRSVGLATELALAQMRGRVSDRGDCLVIETPDDPGYYYGNLLVLPEPPRAGDVARWRARFDAELAGNPAIRHVTFAWDGVDDAAGAVDELEAAGFVIDHTQVMCATSVASPASATSVASAASATSVASAASATSVASTASALAIRRLEPAELTTELAWAIADRHDESYRRFLHRRAAWHRELIARDVAHWWGAFDGDTLVASLGLVDLARGLAHTAATVTSTAPASTAHPASTAPASTAPASTAHPASTAPASTAHPASTAPASTALASTSPAFSAWSGPLAAHARYQDVQTAAAYRRRGLASALLAAAANDAMSRGVESVVIVADPGSAAARVYERAGFSTIEHTVSACLYPISDSRPVRAMTEP